MDKIFISKEIEVTSGLAAVDLIKEKNDVKYFQDKIGITKVDKNRWKEAQYYERKTWCDVAKVLREDRNNEHKTHFDNYAILSSVLKNDISIIELGCGPYTNLRLILPLIKKSISSINLLDPLINDYISNSPNCTYKSGMLDSYKINTIKSSIEEFIPTKKYDLVVMINVLEHCFDIDLIFNNVIEMMNENAILVFADRTREESDIHISLENIYDAGHPILISDNYLREKLKSFKFLYSKEFVGEHNAINKYYILQK